MRGGECKISFFFYQICQNPFIPSGRHWFFFFFLLSIVIIHRLLVRLSKYGTALCSTGIISLPVPNFFHPGTVGISSEIESHQTRVKKSKSKTNKQTKIKKSAYDNNTIILQTKSLIKVLRCGEGWCLWRDKFLELSSYQSYAVACSTVLVR